MSKRIYLVHEIDKRVRRASEHFQPTAIGGGALLSTKQHHIDGAEHLVGSDITTLDATDLAHGLLPKLSGVAGDVLHGDGTWGGAPELTWVMTNKSGASVAAGDIVILDTTTDNSFTTTTTAALETSIGIAQETIANNATGRILVVGIAPLVNVAASVTRGHYLKTSTTAKQATDSASREAGAFGQFLDSSATPRAWIWGAAPRTSAARRCHSTKELGSSRVSLM
jgi:hypothetical protein